MAHPTLTHFKPTPLHAEMALDLGQPNPSRLEIRPNQATGETVQHLTGYIEAITRTTGFSPFRFEIGLDKNDMITEFKAYESQISPNLKSFDVGNVGGFALSNTGVMVFGNNNSLTPDFPDCPPFAFKNPYSETTEIKLSIDWRFGTARIGAALFSVMEIDGDCTSHRTLGLDGPNADLLLHPSDI